MSVPFDIIAPAAGVNYVLNPSCELATTGWTTSTATLSRAVGGRFGASMFRLLASATNGKAIGSGLPQHAGGTAVVASVYVKSSSALVSLQLTYGGTTLSASHSGGGDWERLTIATTATAATTPVISIVDGRTSGWTNVDFDGVMFEEGTAVSTYLDGDQEGCTWDSGPHQSVSRRSARAVGGGRIVSFDSLSLPVMADGVMGIGMPKLDIATQPLAFGDGTVYQRTTAQPRVVTLITKLIGVASYAALHVLRRAILDVLSPDARDGRGPVILRYSGGATPRRLPVILEAGLELEQFEPPNETLPLRFLAPNPFWLAEYDEQVSLTPYATLTSVSGIAQRGADGVWSNMAGGTAGTIGNYVGRLALGLDGILYVGGAWTGGPTGTQYLAQWNGTAWAMVGGVNPNAQVTAVITAPDGKVVVGGYFTLIGATAYVKIARFNPATGSWDAALGTTPATADHIRDLVYDQSGNLWAVGFSTTAGLFAYSWDGSAWTDRATNTAPGPAYCVAVGPNGSLYIGTETNGAYIWGGVGWSSFGATTNGPSATDVIYDMEFGPDGRLYACGAFASIGGVTAALIAAWNGQVWEPLGTGLSGGSDIARSMSFLPTGELIVGGLFLNAGGQICSDGVAVWNGSTWRPYSVNLPGTLGTAATYALLAHPNGSVTIGRETSGSAITPAITTVTNSGTAPAYPVIDAAIANNFQGPYVIENLTTGQTIHTNPNQYLFGGETARLDLRPGRKTFATQTRNMIGSVLPGSDIDGFHLAPGANRIAVFLESSGVDVRAFWKPRYWSAD